MQNERSKVECMLVFQQKRDSSRVECYMITLIGTKEYLKKGKNEVKELRHRPYNSKFISPLSMAIFVKVGIIQTEKLHIKFLADKL